jgi:hypothetical protein
MINTKISLFKIYLTLVRFYNQKHKNTTPKYDPTTKHPISA